MTEKAYWDHTDIAARYGCSTNMAYQIIRAIKYVNSGSVLGGALSRGRVLPSEVAFWEKCRGRREEAMNGASENEEKIHDVLREKGGPWNA